MRLPVTRLLERGRPGAAAVEFCIVAALLFTIFLAMIEVGRAMMVLGAVANAARVGARAGAVTGGDYSAVTSAVDTALGAASLNTSGQVTVTVNGVVVTDDNTFKANATAGVPVSVRVSVTYGSVSWLPAQVGLFLSAQQSLAETAVLCREG
jgi:Flp pilus assembly protein TadG